MIRITGGEFRGRTLKTPPTLRVRPTQSRLRQALFNSLQQEIPDARVADLFAGSGALGFEALSRGASRVVFVEDARASLGAIESNIQELRVKDRSRVLGQSVDSVFLRWDNRIAAEGPFDLILADPPYAEDWEMRLLETGPWEAALKPDGHFCLEWGSLKSRTKTLPEQVPFLVKIREKNYGDSVLSTYRRV